MPVDTPVPVGTILLIDLDRSAPTPLAEQIYAAIRDAIDSGRLAPGSPLASSRALARDLAVARSTVTLAYDHLRKEGYIEGSAGRANRVARQAPQPPRTAVVRRVDPAASPPLSRRSRAVDRLPTEVMNLVGKRPRPFRPGLPALDQFPIDTWQRLMSRAWRRMPPQSLTYGELLGYRPLRQAVAEHLRSARGLPCSEDSVVICNGTQQAFDICMRLTTDVGDAAWVESPGYLGAWLSIEAHGCRVVYVPVDEEGIDVAAGIRTAPDARLAFVTPARQFPLGQPMSAARRRQLLDWARAARAWIFEDDYDGDLRYASAALKPLAALDDAGCVILAGSFSKVVLPALRLGYMVVPPALIERLHRLRLVMDVGTPVFSQAVMADFIGEGHFARHIRRLRSVYQARHDLLVSLLRERLGRGVEVRTCGSGLSVVLWLPHRANDVELARLGPDYDLELTTISHTSPGGPIRPGFLLGFGGLTEPEIRTGVDRLAQLLEKQRVEPVLAETSA